MQIFNQYSYVLGAFFLSLIFFLALWRWQNGPLWARLLLGVVVLLVTVGVGFAFRYPAADVETVQDAETILNNGQPTLMMFYSNY